MEVGGGGGGGGGEGDYIPIATPLGQTGPLFWWKSSVFISRSMTRSRDSI